MKRPHYAEAISTALAQFPVVGLLGPRQRVKTTLARMRVPGFERFPLAERVEVVGLGAWLDDAASRDA